MAHGVTRRLALAIVLSTLGPWAPARDLASKAGDDLVEVWIDLSEPPLASIPAGPDPQREALAARISLQQDTVGARLRQMGAREQGRVRLLRNAIAAWVPPDRLDELRRIPGVVGVRPVRNRRRVKRHVDAT